MSAVSPSEPQASQRTSYSPRYLESCSSASEHAPRIDTFCWSCVPGMQLFDGHHQPFRLGRRYSMLVVGCCPLETWHEATLKAVSEAHLRRRLSLNVPCGARFVDVFRTSILHGHARILVHACELQGRRSRLDLATCSILSAKGRTSQCPRLTKIPLFLPRPLQCLGGNINPKSSQP